VSTTVPRRTALGAAAAVLAGASGGALASCTFTPDSAGGDSGPGSQSTPDPHEVTIREDDAAVLVDPDTEASLAVARGLLARATAVVLVAGDAVSSGTTVATALGIPLLVWGPATAAELDRLGTRTVVRVTGPAPTTEDTGSTPSATSASPSPSPTASPVPDDIGGREVIDADDGAVPDVPGLPPAPPTGRAVALVREDREVDAAAEATLTACGATRLVAGTSDVRLAVTAREGLREEPDAAVLGVTSGLGPAGLLAQRVRTVRVADELPGGGYLPFPERRMVALYGHPQTAALGMLGEQSAAGAVTRVQDLVAEYSALSDDLYVPAFEIIATIASGSAGDDGQYSRRTPVEVLEPWVDAAAEAGVYVVLDLQPGRTDFLTQAKAYESLLRRAHVGLALDPEWRLRPGQVHLRQIGSVGIEEVNGVGAWLAELVRDEDLPPKVLTLHQFNLSMIRGRERLDTGLDEIQWLLHADGQGSQPAKQGTWAALRRDLPDGVWLGWKNFVDEDQPMLTPAQTLARVQPTPYFISYQ
jgi:hypothetical protein